MGVLVIALSINPRPLSVLELKLSGLIMESRVETAEQLKDKYDPCEVVPKQLYILTFYLSWLFPVTLNNIHTVYRLSPMRSTDLCP